MPVPKLDDRSISDIVKQCQDLAALYTPAWAGDTLPHREGRYVVAEFESGAPPRNSPSATAPTRRPPCTFLIAGSARP